MKTIKLPLPAASRSRFVLEATARGTYKRTNRDSYLLNRLHRMGWLDSHEITPAGRLALDPEPLVATAIQATAGAAS